jgi:hypothetical protein
MGRKHGATSEVAAKEARHIGCSPNDTKNDGLLIDKGKFCDGSTLLISTLNMVWLVFWFVCFMLWEYGLLLLFSFLFCNTCIYFLFRRGREEEWSMHMYNDGCEYKMFCPGIIPITSSMFHSADKGREVLLVVASNRQKMLASNIFKKKIHFNVKKISQNTDT